VDPLFVLRAALLGILVSLLATLLPARRAARIQPAEALRHV
jgi:ABC-type lipoprotein release transport system permease subunit